MDDTAPPTLWVRLVADGRFRDAFIEDPLRALADAGPVTVSPEQVQALDELDRDARRDFVVKLVRDAHFHGGQARFGLWDPAWGPGQADAADDDAG